MDWNRYYNNDIPPSFNQIAGFINNDLWNEFNDIIQFSYKTEPHIEYSCCSMQRGWNVKYRKSGKSLCTLYPMVGYFIALIIVGYKEMPEAQLLMPLCTDYVQTIFKSTKTIRNQKWLMIEVKNKETMEDIFNLISLRKRCLR